MRHSTAIFILLFVFILSACDSLVQETSYDQVTTGSFPASVNDIKLGVNGTYDALQNQYTAYYTDTEGILGSIQHHFHRDWMTLTVTDRTAHHGSGIIPLWRQGYNLIGRANYLLSAIKKDPSFKKNPMVKQYEAQLRFLRGYMYFNLVRLFGHIPLVSTPPKSLNDVVLPDTSGDKKLSGQYYDQVKRSKVYNFIEKDLTYAEQHLPDSYNKNNKGRVTKTAASGMLAKVYLTRAGYKWNYNSGGLEKGNPAYYDSVIVETQKVINSTYHLVKNFGDIFDPQTEHNTENLFSVQYISSSTAGQTGEGAGQLQHSNGIKNAPITPYSSNYIKVAIPFFRQWTVANGRNDKRFKATFLISYIDKNGNEVKWGEDPATFPGPAIKKYLFDIDYPNISAQDGSDYGVNWVILRYADVLLMDSEAKNKSSNYSVSQALTGVNLVRDRAGKTDLSSSLTQDALNDSIFAERKWELAFEMHYFFDCQRTGRLKEEIKKSLNKPGTSSQRSKAMYSDKYYILPLPYQALQNNPSLVQNAGWK